MLIEEHVANVWEYFTSIDKKKYGITFPSIPIIYLGNYKNYSNSELKILTLSSLPSRNEFPVDNEFCRFQNMESFYKKMVLDSNDVNYYLNSLDNYFTYNRNEWFDIYEPIINEMSSSFYAGQENSALHIYGLSPLSTNQSWSKYEKTQNPEILEDFIIKGNKILLQILDILQPHIVLASTGEKIKNHIFNNLNLNWKKFDTFTESADGAKRKKPFTVDCSIANFTSGGKYLLIFGSSNVIPFMITNMQKKILGRKINRLIQRSKTQ